MGGLQLCLAEAETSAEDYPFLLHMDFTFIRVFLWKIHRKTVLAAQFYRYIIVCKLLPCIIIFFFSIHYILEFGIIELNYLLTEL